MKLLSDFRLSRNSETLSVALFNLKSLLMFSVTIIIPDIPPIQIPPVLTY